MLRYWIISELRYVGGLILDYTIKLTPDPQLAEIEKMAMQPTDGKGEGKIFI